MKFAIVDIETTGAHGKGHGITEIAAVITDGQEVLETWESLIDPGLPIPSHITQLTGIDEDLIKDAPTFEAVADELEDLLSDCIFVAHNVGFDFSFIRGHFETMGRSWSRPKLCTVRLARKLIPGMGSYSLGNLCERLGISNEARHRAMGDARATTTLFHKMWQLPNGPEHIESSLKKGTRESWLPQHVPASDFDALPLGAGVYQMLDSSGKPLYIGMSHQVRTRIRSHFTGNVSSARRQALLRDVHQIVAQPTGTSFYARLLEDVLIRTHWPMHNRAQKHQPMLHVIVPYRDRQGFERLMVRRSRSKQGGIHHFSNAVEARDWLYQLAATSNLDPGYFGLGTHEGAGEVRAVEHNARLANGLEELLEQRFPALAFCILEGRNEDEAGVVFMQEGRLAGLGWMEGGVAPDTGWEQLSETTSSVARSGLADALVQQAFLCPEEMKEKHFWLCFDANGEPLNRK